jgi:tRNA G18 (ribose-2'-O)-methylase SpoU
MRVPIDDLNDPRIGIYRSLKATNQTRRLEQFVVEGERLVERLLSSRFPVLSVLVTDRSLSKLPTDVPSRVPLYVVPHKRIDELVGFPFHRGLLACGQRQAWPAAAELLAGRDGRLTLVICPKLSDPTNLGTIARIGDVFGIDAILAGPECPDPFSRRVLRVSMGAVLRLPVIVSHELGAVVDDLVRHSQVVLWAAVAASSGVPFDRLARPDRLGLVLGEEDRGLDSDWLKRCARAVTIPMRQGASSLNVAVAAGILLYGVTRGIEDAESV